MTPRVTIQIFSADVFTKGRLLLLSMLTLYSVPRSLQGHIYYPNLNYEKNHIRHLYLCILYSLYLYVTHTVR